MYYDSVRIKTDSNSTPHSRGVMPRPYVGSRDPSGATPDTDKPHIINKDTWERVRHPLLCFGITWVDSK